MNSMGPLSNDDWQWLQGVPLVHKGRGPHIILLAQHSITFPPDPVGSFYKDCNYSTAATKLGTVKLTIFTVEWCLGPPDLPICPKLTSQEFMSIFLTHLINEFDGKHFCY